jgi:dephospho-CoA kinase
VVVVGADERTRLRRLMETRGMTEEDVRSRMAAQATDEQRREAADVWLDNSGTKEALVAAVDTLWHERLVPFEHHVRHGIRSRRPEELALCEPDPAWSAQAQRLLERLRLAFGGLAVTADHVGSTAIPDLVAKDVIDLQVGVPSLEAVDEPALLARLTGAGFPRAAGVYADNDRGSGGTWPKRMHGNADPARVAHIHVRVVGSPGWRWALLFRDWLRARPEVREEYAAEKRRLAGTVASASDYAAAKEPWFDGVHERAETWARETGWEPPRG